MLLSGVSIAEQRCDFRGERLFLPLVLVTRQVPPTSAETMALLIW
jgi:hypothetical protein